MTARDKVIVILGQTATGKSDLAVKIARKINGEIISADSRQVYIGLDIGTGKITKKEMRGIPHHLLDIISAKKKFSVVEYQKIANQAIADILNRGKTPIICGGTGFYIDTLISGTILPEVPPNLKLRKSLDKKTAKDLYKILNKLDKTRAENIDKNNKIRIIRAIEIAKALGEIPKIKKTPAKYDFIKIGLNLPEIKLRKKISDRLDLRIKKGMIKEAKNLHENGISYRRMRELGLEYRHLAFYLEGKTSKQDMISNLNTEIYRYAKRQMTWFKKDKSIYWFDASKKLPLQKILDLFGKTKNSRFGA